MFLKKNNNFFLDFVHFFFFFNISVYWLATWTSTLTLSTRNDFKSTFGIQSNLNRSLKKFDLYLNKANKDGNIYTGQNPLKLRFMKITNVFIFGYRYFYFFLFFFNSNNYNEVYEYSTFKNKNFYKGSLSNIASLFSKWSGFYNFIYNFFYYNNIMYIFGPLFFKNEVLSFNWTVWHSTFALWRNTFNMFFDRHRYSDTTLYFIKRKIGVTTALIADSEYHKFLINSLKLEYIGTLAIVNSSVTSPWNITYPVFFFNYNLYVSLFFSRFVILIKKIILFNLFNLFSNIFKSFTFFNKVIALLH